jgi:hypothetical protein
MGTTIDISGMNFGRLMAQSRTEARSADGSVKWLCTCQCGGSTIACAAHLRSGHTQSCGCLKIERARQGGTRHGLTGSYIFRIWTHIKGRCENPTDAAYPSYGGRGIAICDRWRNDAAMFAADMGPRPSAEHSIERMDNNGPYSPENCIWGTRKQQARNRRSSLLIAFGGATRTLAEWSEVTGIPANTIRNRHMAGRSLFA